MEVPTLDPLWLAGAATLAAAGALGFYELGFICSGAQSKCGRRAIKGGF